jgi:membrane protease YdiL (CAAX protease family)
MFQEKSFGLGKLVFDKEGNLRLFWRCVFYFTTFLTVTILLLFIVNTFFLVPFPQLLDSQINQFLLGSSISLISAIAANWLTMRLFEKLRLKHLGLNLDKKAFVSALGGIFIGFAAISLTAIIAGVLGNYTLEKNTTAGIDAKCLNALLLGAIFFIAAAWEEILFRGYILQTMVRSNQPIAGILISSILFAAIHLLNPNPGIISTLNTLLAGIWFSIGYLRTRSLWLPISMHFSWNWFQTAFFGVEVSGITTLTQSPFLIEMDNGPEWITGGIYGLEGGIAATLVLILIILILSLSKKAELLGNSGH